MTGEQANLIPADARRHKEGRGKGTLADYVPWILMHEISSKGRKHLLPGYKTGREHHLLSDGEAACLSVLEWHPAVIDIREQYPLLPLESTVELADRLGIHHPLDPKNGAQPFVLTIDFVVTLSDDVAVPFKVISFKKSAQLENRATLIRQELERRYLTDYGLEDREVDWSIVTEHELPQILIKNITHLSPRTFGLISQAQMTRIRAALEQHWHPALALTNLGKRVDCDLALEPGSALSVVRQLIYHGLWVCDLRNTIFRVNHPLTDLIVDQRKQMPTWSVRS
ncbi:TnsA endonuclease N-terminal domain-containing protein [Deinococcus sp. AJ005]|uniref:TnsA endonuclease N-terminal domain-containing protein n=1 Tax=Deinococcus sp. AJ005 TaxID=2652443 RepID=UPI00186580DA|nr:TnsA endonuclease N-terminal domain-containing protein [Deinococcus sp. AJ005]